MKAHDWFDAAKKFACEQEDIENLDLSKIVNTAASHRIRLTEHVDFYDANFVQ